MPRYIRIQLTDVQYQELVQTRDGHPKQFIRERAAAAGGTLSAGARPDGGYQVRAVFPLTRAGRP